MNAKSGKGNGAKKRGARTVRGKNGSAGAAPPARATQAKTSETFQLLVEKRSKRSGLFSSDTL